MFYPTAKIWWGKTPSFAELPPSRRELEARNFETAQHINKQITDVFHLQLECGPMPSVMAALPNIGGALCSTPQSLADAHC